MFALVRVASRGAIVPVPAVGRDDGLVVRELGAVDDCGAGGPDELEGGGEEGVLFRISVLEPEDAEARIAERGAIGKQSDAATGRSMVCLRGGIILTRIRTVDGI